MNREPQTGWWIANLANLISISCVVIAQICALFVNHHRTDLTSAGAAFVVQLGQCFAWLTFAWIMIGGVFAAICRRVGRGTASATTTGATAYGLLLVSSVVGLVAVLIGMPSS